MRTRPSLSRTAAALGTGLLLALLPASPAGADPLPEPGSGPFVATALAEDDCTIFFSGGTVHWPMEDPEPSTVSVSGWRSIGEDTATGPCETGPVSDRRIEFTAHGADDAPLDEHIEPFSTDDTDAPYAFALSGEATIESVTVAICLERLPDGSTWPGRCGTAQHLTPSEDTDPQGPYCRYADSSQQWHGGGFLSSIEIIPIEADATDWRIEFDLAEGTSVTALWNGTWTRNAASVTVTNAAWNGTVRTGDTTRLGFTGTGQPPSESTGLTVHVNGEQCLHESMTP